MKNFPQKKRYRVVGRYCSYINQHIKVNLVRGIQKSVEMLSLSQIREWKLSLRSCMSMPEVHIANYEQWRRKCQPAGRRSMSALIAP